MNKPVNPNLENSLGRITTTVGELVETVLKIALESGSSEQEAYHIATVAVNDLLERSHSPREA